MLTGEKFPPFLTHSTLPPGKTLTEIPQCIINFYDKILSDVTGGGRDAKLIDETVAEDWQSRPNGLDVVGGIGPNKDGLKTFMGLFGAIMPNIKFDRQLTLLCDDKVVVLSKVTATIENIPEGMEEIPFWPGIHAEDLLGKSFETLALDVQTIRDGLIKQSWHIEDWQTALEQMLKGKPAPDFGLDLEYLNF